MLFFAAFFQNQRLLYCIEIQWEGGISMKERLTAMLALLLAAVLLLFGSFLILRQRPLTAQQEPGSVSSTVQTMDGAEPDGAAGRYAPRVRREIPGKNEQESGRGPGSGRFQYLRLEKRAPPHLRWRSCFEITDSRPSSPDRCTSPRQSPRQRQTAPLHAPGSSWPGRNNGSHS